MKNILLVFAGGGAGSVIRYLVSTFFTCTPNSFPLATFIVNVSGSLLIGILMGIFIHDAAIQENWKLLLVTGFCGGFTTFSAFSKESFLMIQNQQWSMCIMYVMLSVILCIVATALGFLAVK